MPTRNVSSRLLDREAVPNVVETFDGGSSHQLSHLRFPGTILVESDLNEASCLSAIVICSSSRLEKCHVHGFKQVLAAEAALSQSAG